MGMLIGAILCGIIALIAFGYAAIKKESRVAGISIGCIFVIFTALLLYWSFGTESGQRSWKTFRSENGGGLQRTVDVYDQYGKLLKHYEGKLDVETNDAGTKVLFDLNGKRTVIYGAIVIVQEK